MGELKPGWRRVKFGEVVRQVKDKVDPMTAGIERVIRGEHMDTDDLRIRRWEEVGDDYLGPAFHMRFQPGQVLYGSRRTYLRKVALADFEGITANTTFVVETKDPAILLPELVPFIMTTESFHDHSIKQSKGSVNPYVNFSDLAWYEFALPPLQEQRRVATVLNKAEAAGEARRLAIEGARLLEAALEADRQRGLAEPDGDVANHPIVGRVTTKWDIVPLRKLLRDSQYGLSTAPNGTGEHPILRMMNIDEGWVVENDIKYVDLPRSEFERYQLGFGDVLFNRTNSIDLVGRTGVYGLDGEHVFASYLVRLRVNESVLLPEYLSAFLNGPIGRRQVLSYATKGVSQANVNASNLGRVLVPLPPIEYQTRAISDLRKIREARHSLENRHAAAAALKGCILSNLGGGA